MDDPLAPSHESGEENSSGQNPAQCGDQNPDDHLSPIDAEPVEESRALRFLAEMVGLGVAATGVWVLGEHFANHGFDKIGSAINYIACIGFLGAIPLLVRKTWPRTKTVWRWAVSCCFLLGCVWVLVINLDVRPKPQMELFLNTSESPRTNLLFDKPFLATKPLESKHRLSLEQFKHLLPKACAFLVVPVPRGHTNVTLTFGVKNVSARQYEPVDDVELTADVADLELIVCSTRLRWRAGARWTDVTLDITNNAGRLDFTFPTPLLPGYRQPAPEIIFDVPDDWPEDTAVFAVLRAKRSLNVGRVFKLIIAHIEDHPEPYFETNSIMAVKLRARGKSN
jgi:hypothetical protein